MMISGITTCNLADKVSTSMTSPSADKYDELENNDNYACAMARVHYQRVPASLSEAGDVQAQAGYWSSITTRQKVRAEKKSTSISDTNLCWRNRCDLSRLYCSCFSQLLL